MSTQHRLHVIIGATGGTGGAILRQLVARGERVRAVARSPLTNAPAGVEAVRGDASNAAVMREVCQGADVVYNCVNPPFTRWAELFPQIMDNLIVAAGAANATLVFADDTWMYGKADGPLREDTPYRPCGPKGVLRAQLANQLMIAHKRGDVRAVIGRAPELYGPQVESLLGANLFRAALTGKRALWPANLDSPLNPIFIDDFARALIVLGERAEASGQVWHVPTNSAITGREFTRMLFTDAEKPLKVGVLGRNMVQLLGLVWPIAREGAELMYQYDAPYIIDSTKFRQAFGGSVTPYSSGIAQTLAWYRHVLQDERDQRPAPWWREMWRYGATSK